MPGAPMLTRRERRLLRAIEVDLRQDAVLDRQLREMRYVVPGAGRDGTRARTIRRHLRDYSLIILLPMSVVLLAAARGGAPLAVLIAASLVWTVTLVVAIDCLIAWRRKARDAKSERKPRGGSGGGPGDGAPGGGPTERRDEAS